MRRGEERYNHPEEREDWRVRQREYDEEEDFGSPHDQGEHGVEMSQRGERQRGYERRSPERMEEERRRPSSGMRPFRPYLEQGSREPEYYGYRPEPRFERQYRESYRGAGPSWGESEYRPRNYREQDYPREEERSEPRGWRDYDEEGGRQRGREGFRSENELERPREGERETWNRRRVGSERPERMREYARREPMRASERRGLEEHYGGRERYPEEDRFREGTGRRYGRYDEAESSERGGYGPEPEYGYDEPSRYERERRGGREEDQREDYQDWLEEHQETHPGAEGERQLEGLRSRTGRSRRLSRSEEEESRRPRSRRRADEEFGMREPSQSRHRSGRLREANRSGGASGARPRSKAVSNR